MAERTGLLAAQRRVFESDLRPLDRLVALALLDHWSRTKETFPSVSRLAGCTGLSPRAVRTSLANLEGSGWVRVTRRLGAVNVYDLGPLVTGAPRASVAASDRGTTCPSAIDEPGHDVPTTQAPRASEPGHDVPPKGSRKGSKKEPREGALTKPRRSRRKSTTEIPQDWKPLPRHHDKAQTKGVEIALVAEKFVAHAKANDRRQVDWDAAFDAWLLSERPAKGPALVGAQQGLRNDWKPSRFNAGGVS